MKQLIVLACATLLFASCQKEEEALPTNGDGLVAATVKASSYRVLYCTGCDQNGLNCQQCSCSGSGGNCLPDVVVSRMDRPQVDNVFTAIGTGVQATIVSAFTSNKSVLAKYLANTDIDAVINGTARAIAEPGPNNSRFILIRDLQGKVTAAYPLY
ncbi:MAG: hypothetical protein JSS84_04185 [Bacteroidetes bacterium]|nr:hypothetical protein [Bacteroidota bacterium]